MSGQHGALEAALHPCSAGMGRSLRKAKLTRPKVSVRPKKKVYQKSRAPADLQGQALKAKLQLG